MGRVLILVFVSLIYIHTCYGNIIINEVMANPIDESHDEWIELYNNGSDEIDIAGFYIGDETSNDTIEGGLSNGKGTIIPAGGYAILTDDDTRAYNNFNFSDNIIRLYVKDDSIGNGLKNEGELISLYDGLVLIDKVVYNDTKECMTWSKINDTWTESFPTPGYNNEETKYFIGSKKCNWALEMSYNLTDYYENGDLNLRLRAEKIFGEKTNLSSHIVIKDMFGNIVKEYFPYTNEESTRSKYVGGPYNPTINNLQAYVIESELITSNEDADLRNNFISEILYPKQVAPDKNSYLKIEKFYDLGSDNKAEFGQTVKVRLNIYKGDTSKKAVYIWAEKDNNKISKQSQVNIEEKFSNQTFTIPLQLIPNCEEKYDDGKYNVITKGLDAKDSMQLDVEGITGSLCEEIKVEKKEKKGKITYEIINIPYTVYLGEEFDIILDIENNDNDKVGLEVWSYVYRGNKKYSGEEKDNMVYMTINQKSSKQIKLTNKVIEGKEGDYKLKVKVKKTDLKTSYDLIKDIHLKINKVKEENKSEEIYENLLMDSVDVSLDKDIPELKATIKKGERVVYESNTFMIKKMIPIFLIILFAIAAIFSAIGIKQ